MMRPLLYAVPAIMLAMPAAAQNAFTVFFAFDRADLDSAAIQTIDQAVQAFNTEGSASISIVGHTDTVGSLEYNQALSERRADAVAAAVQERGVPIDAITTAGRSWTEPAVDTGPNVREARNRRAEIVLGGAAAPIPEPEAPAIDRLFVGVGPYFAYNAENPDDDSFLAGGNAVVSYFVTPNVELEGEAALFYEFDTDDEDIGTRLMAGGNYHFGDVFGMLQGVGASPYIGANVGWIGMEGTGTGGLAGGPELGANFGPIDVKLHYDFVEDRDSDDGVYGASITWNFGVGALGF
jgi:hypothetical protein